MKSQRCVFCSPSGALKSFYLLPDLVDATTEVTLSEIFIHYNIVSFGLNSTSKAVWLNSVGDICHQSETKEHASLLARFATSSKKCP